MDNFKQQLAQVTCQPIQEQAKVFLKAFVLEFKGTFGEVLDLAAEFAKYAPIENKDHVRELDEQQVHYFLERNGRSVTVKDLRDAMTAIDLDNNRKVAFIEYALYHYKKTLKQLFAPTGCPREVMEAFEKAVAEYQAALDKKKSQRGQNGGSCKARRTGGSERYDC